MAIVTGAARGMGAAVANRLVAEGSFVSIVDVDGTVARQTANALGDRAIAVAADVASSEGAAAYMEATLARFGRVDLLHNNAGILGQRVPLIDLDVEHFDEVIRVDLRGVFLGMQVMLRQLRAQGSGGVIVNTSSISGLRGRALSSHYTAAKWGVIGLTRCAALEAAEFGVRINAICPAYTNTRMNSAVVVDGRAHIVTQGINQAIPLRRIGEPEEIAALVAWLMSDESSYVTGATISIDGGAAAG